MTPQISSPAPKSGSSKWLVVFLIWLMMLVAYMDRVNISLATSNITSDLHLTKAQMGGILGAFSIGYALMQAPGGWLSDRFGAKPLLIAGLLVWSLFTGITGMCSSLISFVVVRVFFGLGEGLENGAQFKLIGDNFSEKERSRANGMFLSSLALGPAIALPVSSWLIRSIGWRSMFYAYAFVGVLVAAILFVFLPKENRTGSQIRVSPMEILKRPAVWILLIGYLLFNIAFWGFIGWTPTYLREQRHLSLAELGLVGAVPYICGFLGLLIVGQLGSRRLFAKRNLLVAICYIAAALALYFGLSASSKEGALIGLSVASFFLYSAFAPFWSLAIDLAVPEERGALSGIVNFGGQLGGFIGQFAIGLIAGKMKSFDGAILFMSAALILGALVLLTFRSGSTHANSVSG